MTPLRRREYRYPRQIISQWEKDIIELGLQAGWTPHAIAKWLRRPKQTIYHRRKMQRGCNERIRQGCC